MCLAVNRVSSNTSPNVPLDKHSASSTKNVANSHVATLTSETLLNNNDFKIDNARPSFSLTTRSTWQNHPMPNQQHADNRLHNHQQHNRTQRHHDWHKHRLNCISKKLLLGNSDDPLICRGAHSVETTDDDHPLITSLAQTPQNNSNNQMHRSPPNQPTNQSSTTSTMNGRMISPTLPSAHTSKKVPQKGCSSLTKEQLKVKAGLMSAQNRAANEFRKAVISQKSITVVNDANNLLKKKNVIKLRFHHQALPPEYLSHYEAKQRQSSLHVKDKKPHKCEVDPVKVSQTSKLSPPKAAHENVRSWLKKIAAIQQSAQESRESERCKEEIGQHEQTEINFNTITARKDKNNNCQVSGLQEARIKKSSPHLRIADKSEKINSHVGDEKSLPTNSNVLHIPANIREKAETAKRVVNYADLPYMGEITLDNSKPRRGRKPKKTDICHLIYKNYGTVFPGTPTNKLINRNTTPDLNRGTEISRPFDDLPLNLCLRDQQCDYLSISSEESENVCDTFDNNSASVASLQCINTQDANTETLSESKFNASLQISNEKSISVVLKVEPGIENEPFKNSTTNFQKPNCSHQMQFNSKDLLMHPVSIYYQKLLSEALVNQHSEPFGLPVETIEKDNQLTLKIPIPNGLFRTPKSDNSSPSCGADNRNSLIEYPELLSTPSSIKSNMSSITTTTSGRCATANTTATTTATTTIISHNHVVPQKRKRSAIFIPPIPADNTTNPATEVSICKFKFTGGAKPSLQEKKMLSVDSGGNYRYYSGTGDKSTRGYEYFPRESLQNSAGLLPGVNCASHYPNPLGECIPSDIPPPSAELSNEILQIPESPTGTLLPPEHSSPSPISETISLYCSSSALSTQQKMQNNQTMLASDCNSPTNAVLKAETSENVILDTSNSIVNMLQRKNKSRRLSHREKLEKTFKEKGFLIQTQQLESAEGATYCKFRQLKKFTRYLFRNWKDYLPEDVHQAPTFERTETIDQIVHTKENAKDSGSRDIFNEQLVIDSLLERRGLLTSDGGTTQSNDLQNSAGNEHSVDSIM